MSRTRSLPRNPAAKQRAVGAALGPVPGNRRSRTRLDWLDLMERWEDEGYCGSKKPVEFETYMQPEAAVPPAEPRESGEVEAFRVRPPPSDDGAT